MNELPDTEKEAPHLGELDRQQEEADRKEAKFRRVVAEKLVGKFCERLVFDTSKLDRHEFYNVCCLVYDLLHPHEPKPLVPLFLDVEREVF